MTFGLESTFEITIPQKYVLFSKPVHEALSVGILIHHLCLVLQTVRHYHGHLSACYALDLHPTIDILVTCGRDATVRVRQLSVCVPIPVCEYTSVKILVYDCV